MAQAREQPTAENDVVRQPPEFDGFRRDSMRPKGGGQLHQ